MTKLQNSIRARLAEKHLSMIELAERTGLSYGTVRRIAGPGSNPTIEQALLISEALGIAVTDLFSPVKARLGSRGSPPNRSRKRGS